MIMRTKKQRAHVCHAGEHVDSVVLEETRASHLGYRWEVDWNGSDEGNRKASNEIVARVGKGSVGHLFILMFNSRVTHPASKGVDANASNFRFHSGISTVDLPRFAVTSYRLANEQRKSGRSLGSVSV
jgi:hypothetical protein